MTKIFFVPTNGMIPRTFCFLARADVILILPTCGFFDFFCFYIYFDFHLWYQYLCHKKWPIAENTNNVRGDPPSLHMQF